MPLSKPSPRQHNHTRHIECKGFLREDGLWDIEGRITDTKTYSFSNHDREGIHAGENIHDMSVRITLDKEFVIIDAEASIDSSPFSICPGIAHTYKSLIGLDIKPGWRKDVIVRFGREKGCTHINELLLGVMATTAYQTLSGSTVKSSDTQKSLNASRLVNTCHALSSNSSVVQRQWPDEYTGTPIESGEI